MSSMMSSLDADSTLTPLTETSLSPGKSPVVFPLPTARGSAKITFFFDATSGKNEKFHVGEKEEDDSWEKSVLMRWRNRMRRKRTSFFDAV